jgi:Subtilase family
MVDWQFDCHPALSDVCANIKPGWSPPTEPRPVEPETGMSHGCEYMPGQAVIEGPPEIASQFGFEAVGPLDLLPGEPVFDEEVAEAEAGLELLSSQNLGIYKLLDPNASLFEALNQVQDAGHAASPHYELRPAPFWRGGPYSTVNRLDPQWTWDDLQITGRSGADDGRVVIIDSGGQGLPELAHMGIDCDPGDTEPPVPPHPGSKFDPKYVGHGTFAAAIAKKYNPNLRVDLIRAWTKNGVLHEASVLWAMARANPVESVVSLSLGTYPCGPNYNPLVLPVALAVATGGQVVAAAGNDGHDHIPSRMYPASMPLVVGVGAFDVNWSHAQWSNPGEAWAPGEDVVSWYHDGTQGSLAAWSGTSFATPHYAARKASGL